LTLAARYDRHGGSCIDVAVEEPPPGKQSCPTHYHLLEAEHMLILEGRATLRPGERTYEVAAGGYVCFPAGRKAAHALVNDGTAPCRFVIVSDYNPNDAIVDPDPGKVRVQLTGENYRAAATVEYEEGEAVDRG
jgi:uncharacterized cupin superfamily protein